MKKHFLLFMLVLGIGVFTSKAQSNLTYTDSTSSRDGLMTVEWAIVSGYPSRVLYIHTHITKADPYLYNNDDYHWYSVDSSIGGGWGGTMIFDNNGELDIYGSWNLDNWESKTFYFSANYGWAGPGEGSWGEPIYKSDVNFTVQ